MTAVNACKHCMSQRDDAIDRYEKARLLYVKLTNCEYYQHGGNLAGVYCPSELLHEFDDLFDGESK